MKELKFICAQPDDTYFTWQVHLWLESLKEIGHSDKAICLVFTPKHREFNTKWKQIEELYPESEFFYHKTEEDINKLIGIYIPIIRPYILSKYFKLHPELKEKAVFYCDADILFTKNFNIDQYLNDDVCYLSDTNSYINASYFDSKVNDVLPEKKDLYIENDVFNSLLNYIGISREIADKYNLHSGGAQYLLKNIDSDFWEKVMKNCIDIRLYLQSVNRMYFENENKGFQSWCSDMWAVLWTLWLRNQETRVVPEMNFAFSSDNIDKMEHIPIVHNSGIVGEFQTIHQEGKEIQIPTFYKGKYHQGKDPFEDERLYQINIKNKKLCNHYYLEKMIELHKKYKLKY